MTIFQRKYIFRISAITVIITVMTLMIFLEIKEKKSKNNNKLGKTYKIEYDLNGGTVYESSPSSYVAGKTVELPSYVVKEGYGFTGWYDNPNLVGERLYFIPKNMVGNVTLYAGFEDVVGVKCELYDYYSDSQYNPNGSNPKEISDNMTLSSSLFQRFNTRLCVTNDYDETWRRVQYPLYMGGWGFVEEKDGNIGTLKRIIFSNGYKTDLSPSIDETFRVSSAFGNCVQKAVVYPGLVDSVLTGGKITQSRKGGNQRQPLPLFNASYLNNTKHMKTTYMQATMSIGRGYTNLLFPLRRSSREGYYEFNSTHDTVRYNNSTGKLDYLGQDNSQVIDCTGNAGIYPFNVPSDSAVLNDIKESKMNYGYGIRVDIPFYPPYNMKVNGEDVTFEFSGDDDVWVFIDGYLALDLGGHHTKVRGKINLTQGYSVVDKVANPELLDIVGPYFYNQDTWINQSTLNQYKLNSVVGPIQSTFTNYRTNFPQALKNSLADTSTEHSLSIFYLERGKGTSNFIASFNMPIEPKNEVTISNGNKFKNTSSRYYYTYEKSDGKLRTTDKIKFKVETNPGDDVELAISTDKTASKVSKYVQKKYIKLLDKNGNIVNASGHKYKIHGNQEYTCIIDDSYMKSNMQWGEYGIYLHSDLVGNISTVQGKYILRKSFATW